VYEHGTALIIDFLALMLLADSMIRCYDRGIMVDAWEQWLHRSI